MLETTDKPKAFLGLASLAPFAMMFLLLANFGTGGNFESAVIFFIVLTVSLVLAYMILDKDLLAEPINWMGKRAKYAKQQVESFDAKDLIWLPIGVGALLISMFALGAYVPIVGLSIGGAILGYLLLKTENVVVPWIVHAAYNIIAVAASFGFFSVVGVSGFALSSSPVYVPLFNFEGAELNNFAMQAIMQFFAVAFSEEIMKVALANGIALLGSVSRGASVGISAFLWVILHTLLTYRLF